MALFPVHPKRRFSFFRTGMLAVALTAAFVLSRSGGQRTAVLSDALQPSPSPQETVFSEPRPFTRDGRVSSVLVSGAGLRIESPEAPGGYFDVYTADGSVASVAQGTVRVTGTLEGFGCSYGMCLEYGTIRGIEPVPVELR